MSTQAPEIDNKKSKPLLTGAELAENLDVAPATLSEAAHKYYSCGGYPVNEWAEFSETGRIIGYDVPSFLLIESGWGPKNQEERSNPPENEPNKAELGSNKEEELQDTSQKAVTNNYSLLPAGQDYVGPTGMATLPIVIGKALENDTPMSRTVIGGGLSLLFAITAYSMTNNPGGGLVGAATGLGVAIIFMQNSKNQINQLPYIARTLNKQHQIPENSNNLVAIHSEFANMV